MKHITSFLITASLASTPLFAAPATIEADIVVEGGAGSPITLSLSESFSFTLNADFTGWGMYLVAQNVFDTAVSSPSYGYLTGGSGLRLETSTGVTSYAPNYTAGSSYFGSTAIALEFGFDEQMTFAAGTVFTVLAGDVATFSSPVAGAPDRAGPYDFAITDGNGTYFVPTTAAVPEPASYAGVLGVVTLASAALRRRRRTATA